MPDAQILAGGGFYVMFCFNTNLGYRFIFREQVPESKPTPGRVDAKTSPERNRGAEKAKTEKDLETLQNEVDAKAKEKKDNTDFICRELGKRSEYLRGSPGSIGWVVSMMLKGVPADLVDREAVKNALTTIMVGALQERSEYLRDSPGSIGWVVSRMLKGVPADLVDREAVKNALTTIMVGALQERSEYLRGSPGSIGWVVSMMLKGVPADLIDRKAIRKMLDDEIMNKISPAERYKIKPEIDKIFE